MNRFLNLNLAWTVVMAASLVSSLEVAWKSQALGRIGLELFSSMDAAAAFMLLCYFAEAWRKS